MVLDDGAGAAPNPGGAPSYRETGAERTTDDDENATSSTTSSLRARVAQLERELSEAQAYRELYLTAAADAERARADAAASVERARKRFQDKGVEGGEGGGGGGGGK